MGGGKGGKGGGKGGKGGKGGGKKKKSKSRKSLNFRSVPTTDDASVHAAVDAAGPAAAAPRSGKDLWSLDSVEKLVPPPKKPSLMYRLYKSAKRAAGFKSTKKGLALDEEEEEEDDDPGVKPSSSATAPTTTATATATAATTTTMDNGFDRVFVLSLEKSVERRTEVERQMRTLGWNNWEYVDGVDGNAIDYQDAAERGQIVLMDECARRHYMATFSRGEVGCYLGHAEAWRLAAARGYRRTMVLEDKILIDVDVAAALPRVVRSLPSDWAVLHLHSFVQDGAEAWQGGSGSGSGMKQQQKTGARRWANDTDTGDELKRRRADDTALDDVNDLHPLRKKPRKRTLVRTVEIHGGAPSRYHPPLSPSPSSSSPHEHHHRHHHHRRRRRRSPLRHVSIFTGDRENSGTTAYALSAAAALFLNASAFPMRYTTDGAMGCFSYDSRGVPGWKLRRSFSRGKRLPGRAYVIKPFLARERATPFKSEVGSRGGHSAINHHCTCDDIPPPRPPPPRSDDRDIDRLKGNDPDDEQEDDDGLGGGGGSGDGEATKRVGGNVCRPQDCETRRLGFCRATCGVCESVL